MRFAGSFGKGRIFAGIRADSYQGTRRFRQITYFPTGHVSSLCMRSVAAFSYRLVVFRTRALGVSEI